MNKWDERREKHPEEKMLKSVELASPQAKPSLALAVGTAPS